MRKEQEITKLYIEDELEYPYFNLNTERQDNILIKYRFCIKTTKTSDESVDKGVIKVGRRMGWVDDILNENDWDNSHPKFHNAEGNWDIDKFDVFIEEVEEMIKQKEMNPNISMI